jgi:hypothetical protein
MKTYFMFSWRRRALRRLRFIFFHSRRFSLWSSAFLIRYALNRALSSTFSRSTSRCNRFNAASIFSFACTITAIASPIIHKKSFRGNSRPECYLFFRRLSTSFTIRFSHLSFFPSLPNVYEILPATAPAVPVIHSAAVSTRPNL